VRLKDGVIYEKQVDYAKGTIGKPMTGRELEDKFRNLTSRLLSDDRREEIIGVVSGLEQSDNVADLAAMLVVA
jgi:2-methylcitrate dehydratase PrpD